MKRFLALVFAAALVLGAVPFTASVVAATNYVYLENFQSYKTNELPEGWSTFNADGDEYCWYIRRSDYNGEVIFISSSWDDCNTDEYLTMPPVTIPSAVDATYHFSFDIRNTFPEGGGRRDQITVYASTTPITDPSALTEDAIVFDESFRPGSVAWETVTFSLDAFRGQTLYFAIRHVASRIWTLELDNVAVIAEEADRFAVKVQADDEVVTVNPLDGTFRVIDGQDYRFTVDIKDAFQTKNGTVTVKANGKELTAKDGIYTIPKVTEEQELEVLLRYTAGDITGNGAVNLADAARLFYSENGRLELNSVEKAAANIDTFAALDMKDLTALVYYVAGIRSYVDENMDVSLLWNAAYADSANGIDAVGAIDRAAYYLDRRPVKDFSAPATNRDAKAMFYHGGKTRIVNQSDGYAFTLPFADFEADYSLSALRSRYVGDDFVLNVSKETGNPYGNTASGWNTYSSEWLEMYIKNDSFLSNNNLTRTHTTTTTTKTVEGYTIKYYSIHINDAGDIAMPYYNIAIVRKTTEYVKFHLFVMKSTTDRYDAIQAIASSFKEVTPVGVSKNEQTPFVCEPDPNWNEETTAYYNKLLAQNTTDWGFFTESMSDSNSSRENLTAEYADLSSRLDFEYDIMPTYTHIAWYSEMNYFPSSMAKDFAGGNGFNGKPVLQFTYQYTTSNNGNLAGYTPMYDVARGVYDDHFRRLAQDIKLYGKPVLFRLNNEMNTDWTSYSGIVSLLDPDLFAVTWERLYNIFKDEGVDNCIWIFNPFSKSTPYCSWGEDLCYLPDLDTVHVLGLTAYEFGNGATLSSFETMYRNLYEKNSPHFDNYPAIISEFGAGAGGEKMYDWGRNGYVDTVLGRNAAKQAAWVKAMFDCLEKRDQAGYEFCRNIKGAVWFAVNDYAIINEVDYITNYFELNELVADTVAAFKEGLAVHP